MYPAELETKEMPVQYQINKKRIYWYVLSTYPGRYITFYYESEVCTRYRDTLLSSSMYFKAYISYQYVTVLVCTRYILGTYLR